MNYNSANKHGTNANA